MLEKIAKVLQKTKGGKALTITPETTLESLGLDSLDLTQLLLDLEEAFGGVIIETNEAIKDVAGLMRVIERATGD